MQTMIRTIEGPVVLKQDTELLGVATNNVTVAEGAHLLMDGLIMGDLVVLPGASAEVNGTVMGYIINDGGTVKLKGLSEPLGSSGVIPPRVHSDAKRRPSFWGFARSAR